MDLRRKWKGLFILVVFVVLGFSGSSVHADIAVGGTWSAVDGFKMQLNPIEEFEKNIYGSARNEVELNKMDNIQAEVIELDMSWQIVERSI